VLVRDDQGRILVVRTTYLGPGWMLPGGRVERSETPHAAAVRETREETGLSGELLGPLGEIAYSFYSREWSARVSKRVAFFLLAYRSGSTAHHDLEVEGVRLVPAADAEERLTHAGERSIMAAALTRLAAGLPAP
jgi:8-oxo-dGTP pyrophosphatase MutT (NUDIX family)